jgi:hypothetical protein
VISIIICSRKPRLSFNFINNIEETIGCEHQIISIDNSSSSYSIFEAYNIGIKKSNGSILCFLHDDIIIHTQNWGNLLLNYFSKDNDLGLLGVAGAKIKTKMPSGYWNCPTKFKVYNIIQHYKNKTVENIQLGIPVLKTENVVAIDGVFMACRKLENLFFDERLKGFHNYDLYLSMFFLNNNFNIKVTKEIDVEHFSNGEIDYLWFKSNIEFYNIFKDNFPLISEDLRLSNKDLSDIENNNGLNFVFDSLSFSTQPKIMLLWLKLLFKPSNIDWNKKIFRKIFRKVKLI